ncbi:ASST-domain-containing protein [Kockovaella imperatae]|uniref:ASST-domain-containing protein n=1 Tax=Kockovaella imperatae TaxID=4999 RepID=A0A1Y1UPS1_9TREE|nr:ASST-domain-containing protein [Kockovaella imperatae]ORX39567.1 ASST-domain-containing protein [Kockovaella imperatae]
MIFDPYGELVWSGANISGQTLSYNIFTYNGSQVIGVWTGQFEGSGYGMGYDLVLDTAYNTVATINSTLGSPTDFHELSITPDGTALVTVYDKVPYNLSSYGVVTDDPAGGAILQGQFEEIDIATGKGIFNWSSLDHVDPSMSYADPGTTGTDMSNAWDYFHINSIDKDGDGNYLVSSRHCHAIYKIDKTDGHIIWTLNGKNSSFALGNNTAFSWQHDARWRTDYTQMSIFDNAATAFESDAASSRGLLLNIDQSNMTASFALETYPYNYTTSDSQGSMILQPNGNWLMGWGQQPYVSEYDPSGNMLWSFQFGLGTTQSYRAFRSNWTAYPTTSPNISVESNSSSNAYDVYVSWNGATEVQMYHLYHSSSTDGKGLNWLQTANKTGFETWLSVPMSSAAQSDYFQIVAANSANKTLGYTDFMSTDGTTRSPATSSESSSVVSQSPSQTSSVSPSSSSSSTKTGAASKRSFLSAWTRSGLTFGVLVVGMIMGSAAVL